MSKKRIQKKREKREQKRAQKKAKLFKEISKMTDLDISSIPDVSLNNFEYTLKMPKEVLNSGARTITPALALALLWRNVANFRNVNRGWVDKLIQLINSNYYFGKFGPPIYLVKEGDEYRLVDGQHRLLAILESQVSQEVFIVVLDGDQDRGSKVEKLVYALDQNQPRTTRDFAVYEGYPRAFATLSNGLIRQERENSGGSRASWGRVLSYDSIDFIRLHEEALDFVTNLVKGQGEKRKGGGGVASYKVSLVRGFYHMDQERLKEFHMAYSYNYVTNPKTDTAATTLRNYYNLLSSERGAFGGGIVATKNLALYAETALHAFSKKKPLSEITPVEKYGDLLPIEMPTKE
jgi:hypothetical protein